MSKMLMNSLFLGVLVTTSAAISASTQSEAFIAFGGLLPGERVGGLDEVLAEVSNSGTDTIQGRVREYSAWSYGSSLNRRAAFDLSSSVTEPGDFPILSAPVIADNRVIDTLNIGAGGEFADGDPIQILLQVQFDAAVQQQGRASGIMQGDFQLRANEGPVGNSLLVDYTTGALNPPQAFTYSNLWEFLIDATVGSVVTYDSLMQTDINGTAFDPGVTGTNLMSFDATIAFSHAPGYEDLVLTTDSGAPVSPIPVPAAVWLFGSGLIGLIGIARRSKS
ncbi:MAG: VPLPA-CTERM sorting domain-containing protein [Thiotrichales bacterium]|nr:MAG: VPLPA-CTERM sorting domain-containing protein [Thiotrichales bacterium]